MNTEYDFIYGHLPDTQDALIQHLESTLKYDKDKLREEENHIDNLVWNKKEIVLLLVPKGSPRPRHTLATNHFYVKGARDIKKIFRQLFPSGELICTRIKYSLEAYVPTPLSSMNNRQIILAEKGKIRPLSTPDWDNIAKTYTDALQNVLILNDSLINPGKVDKYYSIKPRIKIILEYQSDFDSEYNRRKITNSLKFKNILQLGGK